MVNQTRKIHPHRLNKKFNSKFSEVTDEGQWTQWLKYCDNNKDMDNSQSVNNDNSSFHIFR